MTQGREARREALLDAADAVIRRKGAELIARFAVVWSDTGEPRDRTARAVDR